MLPTEGKGVQETTCCPLSPRGRPPNMCQPPVRPPEIWHPHLSGGSRQGSGKQGTESLLLKPRGAGKTSQAGGDREAGGPPPPPVPQLGRLSLQHSPREGGRAIPKRPQEDTGSLALSQKGSGPVNLLLGQLPRPILVPEPGEGGGDLVIWCTRPPPIQVQGIAP